MTATPRPPDLARTRSRVLAAAATRSTVNPSVHARFPLTFLDAATDTKIARRAAAEVMDPTDYPRRAVLRRTVLPSAALAVLDAIALLVALTAGAKAVAVAAAALLVVFVLIAIGGWRFVAGDPLRLAAGERRAIDAACRWQSSRDWSGGGAELVAPAADAAARICATPFWRSGQIHDVQVHLDLARELDAIDAAAHESNGVPDAVVDRVAALTAYADQVDAFERRRAAGSAGDARRESGGDEDEVVALLRYLNAVR